MDQHTALSWRLHLIQRALELNQIPTKGIAYLASEDEWKSLVRDVEEQTQHTFVTELRSATEITFKGITVIKPKSLA